MSRSSSQSKSGALVTSKSPRQRSKTPPHNPNEPIINRIANQAAGLILNPPPSLIGPGKTFIRNLSMRPSALKVYSVDLGCSVSKSLASSLVGQSVLSTALGAELTAAASLTSAAQAQALGLLALRIQLGAAGSLLGGGQGIQRFTSLIVDYASRNAVAVSEMAKMSSASQIATIGLKGTVVGAIATAAVQESIAVAYYCHGGGTLDVLSHQSVTIGMSAASTVGGGTVGAAVGCLLFPGIGTALGSLLGGYVGSMVPFYSRGNGYAHQPNEDARHPSRKLKTVDARVHSTRAFRGDTAEMGGGWLEVVDCSTESYFRFAEDGAGGIGASAQDSLAMLRDMSRGGGNDSIGNGPNSSAMCGFGASSTSTQRPFTDSQSSAPPQNSWASLLSPTQLWGGSSRATAEGKGTPKQQPTTSSFFVDSSSDIVTPEANEMIIYFRPLSGAEAADATNDTTRTFASCASTNSL